MRALILNSGKGTRMGEITELHPKCMTKITEEDTILSRQLRQLSKAGIKEIVITTGPFAVLLKNCCQQLSLPVHFTFVRNPDFDSTNYIYSIYLAKEYLYDDILLLHGDLVFSDKVLEMVMSNKNSCMAISSTVPLPQKDFKAVVEGNKIFKVGVEFFTNAFAAQPLYKILKKDWLIWLSEIIKFCEDNQKKCYAENAFNQVSNLCNIFALDVKNGLCNEIDDEVDLKNIRGILKNER